MNTTRRKIIRQALASTIVTCVPFSSFANESEVLLDLDELCLEWTRHARWLQIRHCIAGPVYNSLLTGMSRQYVADYVHKHGKLPTGRHLATYRCGTDKKNDVHAEHCGSTRLIKEWITYPDVPLINSLTLAS